jgi:DNA-binding XRE family transcriptional regulator
MTANDLREWQARHGYTYDTAAVALGVSRRTYAGYLARADDLPRMLELACKALDLMSICNDLDKQSAVAKKRVAPSSD